MIVAVYNHWQLKFRSRAWFFPIAFCIFTQNLLSVFVWVDGIFVTSKITKNRVFATKPRMWFWPLILKFRKNRNDYGVCTEKPYIFRFLYCLLLSDFDGFYTISVGFFDDYGVCPFSGYNFFVVFIFSVNNFILCTNSTEISGFSVLLCFLRLSLLT